MPRKRGQILVIRGGAIGDFILTLPAINALRGTFPDTHLELLGYPVLAELARAAGIIDAFRSIEARPLARFFARNAPLDPEWSAYFESFNLIISYLYDPDEIFKTNVGRTTKAQFIHGPHRPSEQEASHATAVFLKQLEQLAIFDFDPVPKLILISDESLPPGPWLAVHPGSGSEKKNWPEAKWIDLLQQLLKETNANLLLIGGEAEGEKLKRIRALLPSTRVRLAQNLPLWEVARLLGQCTAFIGHDSGITHLAAALGIPALALWGPSNDQIWKPLHRGTLIVKSERLEDLPVESVRTALQSLIERTSSP
jgi:ADP-heptose:LPS heptosyltransferase